MNMRDFQQQVDTFHGRCQERLTGIGAEQYYDPATETQTFENESLDYLIEGAIEEILDLSNYAAMQYIKLRQLQERLSLLA